MSADVEADTVIVGSGVAGALVARAALAAGDTVALLERGALVPWQEQIERTAWEADVPGAEHITRTTRTARTGPGPTCTASAAAPCGGPA